MPGVLPRAFPPFGFLVMVNQTRNAVHWHGSNACVVNDCVHNKLRFIVYRQRPLDFRFSFFHPFLTQAWRFFVVVAVVPTIQRAGCVAPEFATDSVWFHSVFCPRFLIPKCLIVGFRAGEIQFFFEYGLFSQICKYGIIEVEICFSTPHSFETLLVSMVMPDTTYANNIAVLFETLGKHTAVVRCDAYCRRVTLRAFGCRAAGLDNLTHVDSDTCTTKVFRNLHGFIAYFGVKQRINHLAVAAAASCKFFVVLLNLERLSQLVDGCCIYMAHVRV